MAAATQNRIFSTGILRIGAPGATPLATDGSTTIGQIQDISVDITYDRHEVNEAAQISEFAVDTADSGGKASIKFNTPDMNRLLLPYAAGMAKTTAGSVDTFTLSKTSKPAYSRIEIDTVDSAGKNIKIVAQQSKLKGFSTSAKVTDFAGNSFEADVYIDASGNILTIAMDQ
jgi:hypothetical protein